MINMRKKMTPSFKVSLFLENIVVNKLFNDNPKKMKKYIRDSLKKNQGDEYNNIVVENILLEMFDDIEFAKNRLINEISSYQDNDVSSN